MEKGDKVGIVCCSNGISLQRKNEIDSLCNTLRQLDIIPVLSDYIYQKDNVFSGIASTRANALMNFYKDDEIKAIFDISGGDIANELLPYLDFTVIKQHPKLFFGYSDLTVIINSLYQLSHLPSVLYQVRNIVKIEKRRDELASFLLKNTPDLLHFSYQFIQGDQLEGMVVGGNIRCLLKLAGTKYFPDMQDKILLLEAYGGKTAQMSTYLAQLQQLGVFDKIKGVILGTFTKMEESDSKPTMIELIAPYIKDLPLIKTNEIGHNIDAKAIMIGKVISLKNKS